MNAETIATMTKSVAMKATVAPSRPGAVTTKETGLARQADEWAH
jgi:hypothetical protein